MPFFELQEKRIDQWFMGWWDARIGWLSRKTNYKRPEITVRLYHLGMHGVNSQLICLTRPQKPQESDSGAMTKSNRWTIASTVCTILVCFWAPWVHFWQKILEFHPFKKSQLCTVLIIFFHIFLFAWLKGSLFNFFLWHIHVMWFFTFLSHFDHDVTLNWPWHVMVLVNFFPS